MPVILKRKTARFYKRQNIGGRRSQNTETKSLRAKYAPFAHDALEDSQKQIRLLRILHSTTDESPLEVELTTWTTEEAPPYSAISYAWGSLEEKVLYCNNKILRVRSNCHYALLQVRRYQRLQNMAQNIYIWMDSICINQTDLLEKGHQVREMYHIYRRAVKVLACVGPEADGSESVMQTANEALEWKNLSFGPPNHILSSLGEDRISFLHRALRLFSNRPYWTRLWIIQELHAASRTNDVDTDVLVLCGSAWASLKDVHTVVTLLHDANLHDDARWHEHTNDEDPKTSPRFKYTPLETILYHTYLLKFRDIFTTFVDFQCLDPRDRIYGLLHLADMPPSFADSIPDYTITTWELARRAAKFLVLSDVSNLLRTLDIDCTHPQVQALVSNSSYGDDDPSMSNSQMSPSNSPSVSKLAPPSPRSLPSPSAASFIGMTHPVTLEPSDSASSKAALANMYPYLEYEKKWQSFSRDHLPHQCLQTRSDHITALSDLPRVPEIFRTMNSATSSAKRPTTLSLERLNGLLTQHPPKVIISGSGPIAIVCYETKPHDILVIYERNEYSTILVVRSPIDLGGSGSQTMDIVGQGFLISNPAFLTQPETKQSFNAFTSEVWLDILPEEAMLLAGQDTMGKSGIDLLSCLFRLFTAPTRMPSKAVAIWGDPYEEMGDVDEDPVPDGMAERLTDEEQSAWAGSSEHSCWSGCEWDGLAGRMVHYSTRLRDEEAEQDRWDESEKSSERSW